MGVMNVMEKVKITERQARSIETLLKVWDGDLERCVIGKVGGFKSAYEPINEMSFDDFVKALYNGYEIEPEFKANDYVLFDDNSIGRYIPVSKGFSVKCYPVRHATPEEIEQEKERSKWFAIGREVNEFRNDDIVKDRSGKFGFHYRAILSVNQNTARCTGGIDIPVIDLKLVCPSENRVD